MVTQSFIRVTTSAAEAWAATESWSWSSAEAESIINNSLTEQILDAELQTKLYSHSMPKHGGLVQLCQIRGCTNVEHFELRGGLCCIHHTGEQKIDSAAPDMSEAEEHIQQSSLEVCIDSTTTNKEDKECCNKHSVHGRNDESLGEKKRALPAGDPTSGDKKTKKCKKVDAFVLDLSDVPPQMPI